MTALGRMIARRKSGNCLRCPRDIMAHGRSEKRQANSNAFSPRQCHGNVIRGQTARSLFRHWGGSGRGPPLYSALNASTESTLVALHAGTRMAVSPVPPRITCPALNACSNGFARSVVDRMWEVGDEIWLKYVSGFQVMAMPSTGCEASCPAHVGRGVSFRDESGSSGAVWGVTRRNGRYRPSVESGRIHSFRQ
jgi:hypothetical protein